MTIRYGGLPALWWLRFKLLFHRDWSVYDPFDVAVLYRGSRRECKQVIDQLPGGTYLIVPSFDLEDSWSS